MPDLMQTPFETFDKQPRVEPDFELRSGPTGISLPASGPAAIWRGLRGNCPRCGQARLFGRFLKPVSRCAQCGQDMTHQQADDFPAYLSILISGHLLAPVIIALTRDTALSTAALMAIIVPLAIVMLIAMLQPAKGAVIAAQWWFGLHGFRIERAAICPAQASSADQGKSESQQSLCVDQDQGSAVHRKV